jgi:hypothetical protein
MVGDGREGAAVEKKLFRVDVVLYVMAENESVACAVATEVKFDVFECVPERVRFLDPLWEDAIPYNYDNELTCKEIMKGNNQVTHPTAEILN